jgi:hypothetical protein
MILGTGGVDVDHLLWPVRTVRLRSSAQVLLCLNLGPGSVLGGQVKRYNLVTEEELSQVAWSDQQDAGGL